MHNITKPRPWRGGAEITEDVFEDAQPLKRVEVTRQEWTEHGQVISARILQFRGTRGNSGLCETSTHESRGVTKKGNKQLQGKHRSWS